MCMWQVYVTAAKMSWGWCCSSNFTEPIVYVTDVMSPQALMLLACYFSLSSGEFISTSSHICDSWYLPIFLLRVGSLTLIWMASLMDLAKFWSSLPTMLKLSIDISWPVVLWWSWMGDGAFMHSLYLSANVLPYSQMYSSSQSQHWIGLWFCINNLVPYLLVPGVTHHTMNGAICGRYKYWQV